MATEDNTDEAVVTAREWIRSRGLDPDAPEWRQFIAGMMESGEFSDDALQELKSFTGVDTSR